MAERAVTPVSRRILLFTGAPRESELDWTEEHLLKEPLPLFPIENYSRRDVSDGEGSSEAVPMPRWRVIPLTTPALHSGFTQTAEWQEKTTFDVIPGAAGISFLSTVADSQDSSALTEEDVLDYEQTFLEQSFALHEGVSISESDETTSFGDTSAGFMLKSFPTTSSNSDPSLDETENSIQDGRGAHVTSTGPNVLPSKTKVFPLALLPRAGQLQAMSPQAPIVSAMRAATHLESLSGCPRWAPPTGRAHWPRKRVGKIYE
jgi:hypothetical protein